MAVVYDIEHTTSYKYKTPVTLAEHLALFLPRVGHGGRVSPAWGRHPRSATDSGTAREFRGARTRAGPGGFLNA